MGIIAWVQRGRTWKFEWKCCNFCWYNW